MVKRFLLLGVLLVVVGLLSSTALAMDPMGPPVAGLAQGQWSASLDYAFSETDLEFDGEFNWDAEGFSPFAPVSDKLTFEAVEMHKGYLTIGYGINDNWEIFGRIGGARAETKKPERYMEKDLGYYDDPGSYAGYMYMWEEGHPHDFDTGLALGFGTKVTLWEDTNLKVGGLFQASYSEMDVRAKYEGYSYFGDTYVPEGDWFTSAEGELDLWEIQIAIGATYELSPSFTVYGGPFWHFVTGDYDFKGEGEYAIWDEYWNDFDSEYYWAISDWWDLCNWGDYDVENDSQFGGYLGAQIDVTENVACNAECMLTGDGYGVGTSLIWRF